MQGKRLLIINNLIIAGLIFIRIIDFGWLLITFGLIVLLPITLFHIISSNIGFLRISSFIKSEKILLFTSSYAFIIFILFQYEMDDRAGYMVIEWIFRKWFIGFDNYSQNFATISTVITITSGLLFIFIDIFLLIRLKRINQRQTASLQGKTL